MNLADSDVFVKFKKLWLENNQKFAKVPDQGIVKKKRRAYWGHFAVSAIFGRKKLKRKLVWVILRCYTTHERGEI